MKERCHNKLLIFLLILSIIIPNGINIHINQVLAAQTGTVTATTLNVRTEPSTTSSKVTLEDGTYVYLNKGETVNILDQEGDFYHVSLKFNGKTIKGYVHKDFVKVTGGTTATPTPKPTATPKPTVTPKPTTAATPTPAAGSSVSVTKIVEISASVTASTLNVRSGPGTSYSKVAGLVKGNTVTVINEKMGSDTKWYAISFKQSGKTLTGYVSSAFIKLSYKTAVKAEISASKLKIRSKASSSAAYMKDSNGTAITLKEGKNVTISLETTVKEIKWFRVTFTVGDKKYTGYTEADKVRFRKTVADPTATPTPKPTATPKPTVTPKPTSKPTTTPKPTVTTAPTVTPIPTPSSVYTVDNVIIYDNITTPYTGKVCNTLYLNVFEYYQNILGLLMDSNSNPILLQSAQTVTVTQALTISDVKFYQISFQINGKQMTGYVQAAYIYIDSSAPAVTATPSPTPTISPDFETYLTQEGFPESYKPALRTLHTLYPNWVFKAYQTGLDWNAVISEESKPGKNLIPNTKSVEWLSFVSGAYDWETDTFQPFDGTTWVTASQTAVEYYMDPRNFLTTSGIFQFELLKFQSSYQTISGVEKMLKGTPLDATYTYVNDSKKSTKISYAQTFMDAAAYSGVSPYHLASRVKQEVITSSMTFSGSASGTYSGYEGYYNFFNIGASDSAGGGAIAKGLTFAKSGNSTTAKDSLYLIPWTNPYRAILGGAYYIGKGYISRGQDTIYLQKFNVTATSTYYHQYMSNVEAPYAEGKKVLAAYGGMLEGTPIVFSIPVYLNMPETVAVYPTKMYNPNNRMKSLQIVTADGTKLAITPTFSQTQHSYDLIVDNSISSVTITAKAVSSKAKVSGGGTVALSVGTNTIVIAVTAENGEVSNYTITIVRSQAPVTTTPAAQ